MLVRLLEDLTTSHLAERGDVDLALQAVSLAQLCSAVSRERPTGGDASATVQIPADAVVIADPLRANQVVDNLVSNALRYGGPHVHVSAQRRGHVVDLVVADDGPGIPEELQERLFEAYAHGSASHSLGGSGLGLAIVRELCDAMDGSISYDGSGPGARFVVTLPAVPTVACERSEELRVPGHDALLWRSADAFGRRLAAYVTGLGSPAAKRSWWRPPRPTEPSSRRAWWGWDSTRSGSRRADSTSPSTPSRCAVSSTSTATSPARPSRGWSARSSTASSGGG